ncbi:MAG: hypothetical protein LC808_09660 [Actinobacteria bacterium]|nr:hypothetical protein [Actinomycetota bacterium]
MTEVLMGRYELTFEVDELADDIIDAIYDRFDALVSAHAHVTLITLTAEGPTAVVAGKRAVEEPESELRVVVRRSVEDLVTRADIASRCDVTPQAVGQWIRGARQREASFPARFSLVAGGIWLWGEVNDWLRRVGKPHDGDLCFPRREDHDELNLWLKERRVSQRVPHVTAELRFPNDTRARPARHSGVFARPQTRGFVVFQRTSSKASSS